MRSGARGRTSSKHLVETIALAHDLLGQHTRTHTCTQRHTRAFERERGDQREEESSHGEGKERVISGEAQTRVRSGDGNYNASAPVYCPPPASIWATREHSASTAAAAAAATPAAATVTPAFLSAVFPPPGDARCVARARPGRYTSPAVAVAAARLRGPLSRSRWLTARLSLHSPRNRCVVSTRPRGVVRCGGGVSVERKGDRCGRRKGHL